ncbi:acetoacetyl-CoA reductase [Candidatus Paracaedibacter symbiosus]|uniref:acetoacetyl-CoA reductase n=1 Tax=Candidatus Paracaedibacter symbiosus TaxID=244582 RepID=UPI0005097B39|nr:acetoacetyl-CoA reductase [Candidatus Paracaedibacter symbiosus]
MRIAVVTGGTRGIGAAISKQLKEAGYMVVANYMSNDEAAQEFHHQTGVEVMRWDVGDYEPCKKAVHEILAKHGTIDVLVNNAGITRDAFLHKTTPQMWHEVINTNLTSCFNMCHSVVPYMRERAFGRVINISSINGQKGQIGQVNYSAAKAGMIGLTKALALECASKGITVNAIAPGYIKTDMVGALDQNVLQSIVSQIPVGRLGTPEEIAAVVEFLSSDAAGFITGATIATNGGQYLG